VTTVAEPVVAPADALPVDVAGSRSTSWWGMVLFIVTEATLFLLLFVSYFYLRFRAVHWPIGDVEPPKLALPGAMTAVLLGSSVPMFWAELGIKKGNVRRLEAGLAASAALGVGFLVLMGVEYAQDLKDFTPRTNAYGSIFYLITGLHGAHVCIGLMMNGFTQLRAWLGHFDAHRHAAVQNAALYWHFVDALWVLIMLIVYLSPHTSL